MKEAIRAGMKVYMEAFAKEKGTGEPRRKKQIENEAIRQARIAAGKVILPLPEKMLLFPLGGLYHDLVKLFKDVRDSEITESYRYNFMVYVGEKEILRKLERRSRTPRQLAEEYLKKHFEFATDFHLREARKLFQGKS